MTPQKKYLFIVNPISGDVDKSEMIEETLAFTAKNNSEVIIFETDYLKKSDIETLNKKLESFLGESHIPEITLITNNDLGINGTITNALEAFYSED